MQYSGHLIRRLYVSSYTLRTYPEKNLNLSHQYYMLHNKIILPLLSVLWTGFINNLPPAGLGYLANGTVLNCVGSPALIDTVANLFFLIAVELSVVRYVTGIAVQPAVQPHGLLIRVKPFFYQVYCRAVV